MSCTRLVLSLNPHSLQEVRSLLTKGRGLADLLEFRLDLFPPFSLGELQELLELAPCPVIFTLRGKKEGGSFSGSEKERQRRILELAALCPAYFDLESSLPPSFIETFTLLYPSVKLLISYHHTTYPCPPLDEILLAVQKHKASLYKIALTVENSVEALALLSFTTPSLTLIGMGREGEVSRLLAPLVKAPLAYTCLEQEQTAPGQIPLSTLLSHYAFPQLSPETALYGLIGDPVEASISDQTHNALFRKENLDALYVKMRTPSSTLASFFSLAKDLGFRGLSVTMPLKESLFPFLEEIDPEASKIGAVNTLIMENGRWKGYNTDGLGALDALESHGPVLHKTIGLLGAGGASKAIAYEALKRGANVLLFVRDIHKAKPLAERLSVPLFPLSSLANATFDILISCLPPSAPLPPLPSFSFLAMDIITKPLYTPLLIQAKNKGCPIIFGYEMFIRQAARQFALWMPHLKQETLVAYLQEQALQALT